MANNNNKNNKKKFTLVQQVGNNSTSNNSEITIESAKITPEIFIEQKLSLNDYFALSTMVQSVIIFC